MPTYLPSNDQQYSEWINRFSTYLHDNAARIGLTPEQMDVLNVLHLRWDTDFDAHTTAHAAARTATRTKDTTRGILDEIVRAYVRIIQACPATTDTDRAALSLTIPGTGSSGLELSYVDKPQPEIDIRVHLAHNIKVRTWTPEGVRKAKPAGVMGCEVVRTIGDRPATQEEMQLVGVIPGTKVTFSYGAENAGKQAHYAMRWLSTDGTPGAWSDIVSATIAA